MLIDDRKILVRSYKAKKGSSIHQAPACFVLEGRLRRCYLENWRKRYTLPAWSGGQGAYTLQGRFSAVSGINFDCLIPRHTRFIFPTTTLWIASPPLTTECSLLYEVIDSVSAQNMKIPNTSHIVDHPKEFSTLGEVTEVLSLFLCSGFSSVHGLLKNNTKVQTNILIDQFWHCPLPF